MKYSFILLTFQVPIPKGYFHFHFLNKPSIQQKTIASKLNQNWPVKHMNCHGANFVDLKLQPQKIKQKIN